jgi:hypothetical protein
VKSTRQQNMVIICGISFIFALVLFAYAGIHGDKIFAYPGADQMSNSSNYENGYPDSTAGNLALSGYPASNQFIDINGDCRPSIDSRTNNQTIINPCAKSVLPPSSTATKTPQPIVDYDLTGWPTPTLNPFPSPSAPRQGVAAAGGMNTISQRHIFGRWGYHWGIGVPTPYPSNMEHIPMLAWDTWSNGPPSIVQIQTSATRTPHDYWLVFNECEHQSQCDKSPTVAAQFYYSQIVYTMFDQSIPGGQLGIDPIAKLIVGGVNAHPCGIKWLSEFVEAYRDITEQELGEAQDPPHAGWHFHLYPEIYPEGWSYENQDCSGNWDS